MRVALYQNDPEFGAVEKNIKTLLSDVQDKHFDILVLPELFATGYQFKDRDEAAALADRTGEGFVFETIRRISEEKDALIIYGFPELSGEDLFNSALAILPDGSCHLYRKLHLFDTEKLIFRPGENGFFVFPFREARIGIMICFDWRFPESARKLSLLGAQIICHPSNLVLSHCPDAMITRALENNVFTITSNRIGEENRTGQRLRFIGKSRIIAPGGQILAKAGASETRGLAENALFGGRS